MMFQEFVNRVVETTGVGVRGMPALMKLGAELFVLPLARLNPALFFFFVLGGEDPIDHVQRRRLRAGIAHPLLERIIRIHVTEEARHLSFARHTLEQMVPALPRWRRATLSVAIPLILGTMARLMLATPRAFAREHRIPRAVVREANRSPEHAAALADSVKKIRRLCSAIGLINPFSRALWRWVGLWGPIDGSDTTVATSSEEAR
jgi:P-aminobenzoate N-oxygenase AurF